MPLFSRKKFTVDGKTNSLPSTPVRRPHLVSNGSASIDHISVQNEIRQETTFNEEESSFLYVTPLRTKSRLSHSFDDLLSDNAASSFFIQYMSSREVSMLIKFWFDAKSFYASSQARLQTCNSGKSDDSCNRLKCATGGIENEKQCKDISNGAEYGDASSEIMPIIPEDSVTDERVSMSQVQEKPPSSEIHFENEKTVDVVDSLKEGNFNTVDSVCIVDKLKKSIAEDAVKLFTKYIAKDATHPIGVNDDMRNEITAKICREDGEVDINCFSAAMQFVYEIMYRDYFHDFLLSHFHCKYQIDVLTSGKIFLEDLLYNDTALSFFTEFLEQEGKRHLLEFWLIADNFRQHLTSRMGNYKGSEAQDDAMVLYDKFFSLQATCPLGFSDNVRFEVEQNICREEGPLPDCFEKPVKMVFYYLQKNYLKPFLSSQIYFTYLSDLLNSARSRADGLSLKKRSGSDTSSECSVSTQNTLLAMDTTHPGSSSTKKGQQHPAQDMRIDAGIFHPDALWKRSMAGKLSFGHVNSMGQFIPEVEPEPDKKKFSESVLSKAMRKLVNRDEDKAKEDMAWQVARMIVREVTEITTRHGEMKDVI